jgi:mutator protein MutT
MIHVVAAAVADAAGRILIAQRQPGKHLAGGWEFPGGKLEPGETRRMGLARELREELGIAIREPRPLLRVRHTYPYGEVLLDTWVVSRYDGEPRGVDGQALRWLDQDELASAPLLPADRPIVRALRLPDRLDARSSAYYAVGEVGCGAAGCGAADKLGGVLCRTVEDARASARTADFLVMQYPLPGAELRSLCEAVAIPVFARGLALEAAWELGASGINTLAQ